MPLKGWGGYLIAPGNGVYDEAASITYVENLVDDLYVKGYDAVRYQSIPSFLTTSTLHRIKYPVLDALILAAQQKNPPMTVITNPIHNYPQDPTSDIMQANFYDWRGLLGYIATRYNDMTNVVLQCVNEYTLRDGNGTRTSTAQPGPDYKFQNIVDYLRAGAPTTTPPTPPIVLPLHFNLMWTDHHTGASIGHLDNGPVDPLGLTTVGHHHYGNNFVAARSIAVGETWEEYVVNIGLSDTMDRLFGNTTDPTFYGNAQLNGIKCMITEAGPNSNTSSSGTGYTIGNMAYAREILRRAVAEDVGIIMFRTGDDSDREAQENLVRQYFNLAYEPWSTPTPGILTITTSPIAGNIYLSGVLVGVGTYGPVEIPAGTYSVSYGDVAGYATPVALDVTIEEGQTVSLDGSYTQMINGFLNVMTVEYISDNIMQLVEGSILINGRLVGVGTYQADLPAGNISIDYGTLDGYDKPASVIAPITVGVTTTITGVYVRRIEPELITPFPYMALGTMLIGGVIAGVSRKKK